MSAAVVEAYRELYPEAQGPADDADSPRLRLPAIVSDSKLDNESPISSKEPEDVRLPRLAGQSRSVPSLHLPGKLRKAMAQATAAQAFQQAGVVHKSRRVHAVSAFDV